MKICWIEPDNACVEIDNVTLELELETFDEFVIDDNCVREFSYTQHNPIIKAIHISDDDELPALTAEQEAHYRNMLDCNEFYKAYQNCFESDFRWGKSVSGWY